MFPTSYFPSEYYAPRYFPRNGESNLSTAICGELTIEVIATVTSTSLDEIATATLTLVNCDS